MRPLYTERTPRVVAARRLTRRSVRSETGRFLAEGPQAVAEALGRADAASQVRELFGTDEALARYADLVGRAEALGVPTSRVTGRGMAGLSETVSPQGLVAVCRSLHLPLAGVLPPADPGVSGAPGRPAVPRLVAVLADVGDPGNAGTVLRSADAAGAGAVVFAGDSVDPYNGKCVRASAGSLFHLAVVRGGSVAEAVGAARSAGLQVLAATGSGRDDLFDLADSGELAGPTAWLLGNEARGLAGPDAALADRTVRVPMPGRAESLNLAAAAAVCLFASARAHMSDR
ncbi:MAG TPA: RNA methyltransferase [Mycobacteriales bacterium]|nr:RNA methyltransferase [Mycobacteriales bacterium]